MTGNIDAIRHFVLTLQNVCTVGIYSYRTEINYMNIPDRALTIFLNGVLVIGTLHMLNVVVMPGVSEVQKLFVFLRLLL